RCRRRPWPGLRPHPGRRRPVLSPRPSAARCSPGRGARIRLRIDPYPRRPMKLFLDTADIEEIRIANRWGILDGVTTNPTLYAKVGGSYEEILAEVCRITSGPVSAEVVSDDVDGMLEEGRRYAKIAPNIYVKVAMSENGLEAISRLADEGIGTNCTLIF